MFHCWPTSLTFLYSFLSGKKIKAYMAIVFCVPFFPPARNKQRRTFVPRNAHERNKICLYLGCRAREQFHVHPTKPNLKDNGFLTRAFTNKQSWLECQKSGENSSKYTRLNFFQHPSYWILGICWAGSQTWNNVWTWKMRNTIHAHGKLVERRGLASRRGRSTLHRCASG